MRAKAYSIMVFIGILMLLPASAWCLGLGERIPDFSIATLEGEQISSSELRGEPALMVFWNTWCSNCRRELPKIDKILQNNSLGRAKVLAVNTNINDSLAKARSYWSDTELKFTSGYDSDFSVSSIFRIIGVPTILLFDSNGILQYKGTRLPQDISRLLYPEQASPPEG